jgi:glycosyltransferase involved in cell wall biosynthesis
VLYVGGFDLRKNMAGAIRGYALLPASVRATYDLVLACWLPDEVLAPLVRLTQELGVAGSIKFTGFVTDEELVSLYQTCRVFFFPSLYEGLGLPPVEAMQCGAPVVTSDCSSMPEYGGPVSWYCDPTSPASMAEALRKALAEPRDLRRAERERFAAQFNWADVAERAARALERATPAPAVPRKPRIAWVCPTPPTETGIADYAAEVAGALSDRFELEWVCDPKNPPPDSAIARHAGVVPGNEIDGRHAANPFDLFVYHMGNNYFHTYMLSMMRRHPGAVVVHDLHLGGLFRLSHEGVGVWPGSWHEELEYNGDWHLAYWVKVGQMHSHVAPTFGPMNRRVLEGAPFLVVHSGWAWNQTRRVTDAPVTIVPLIAAPPRVGTRAAERTRLGLPADRFIVSTLGHVGPPKRVPALIHAAAELPPDVRSRTLVLIVGPVCQADREHFEWLAESQGIPGQVEVRGRVPLEDFPAYAVASDVCVQLRFPSHGETSAALVRAMAAGACCITSDMPTMAEIPNTATIKVRSPIRDVADLTAALTRLAREPEQRDRLGANAKQFMAETHGPAVVAAKYAAAIDQAMAIQRASDGRWMADALNALADLPGGVPDGLIEQWAKLRTRVLRPTAEVVPELPEVPAERQTGKQAA